MTEAESKKKTMETQSGLDGNALQSHDSTSVKKRRRRRKKKSAGASLSGNTDQSMNQIDSDDNEEQNTKEKVLDTSESLTQTMTENMETECDAKADEDTAEQTECDAKADEDTAEQTECDAKADEDTAEQTECDAKADEDTAEQTECDAKAVEDTTEKTCTTAAVPQVIPQISGSSVPSGTVAMSNLHPTPNVVHSSSPPFTAIQSQQSRGTSLANSADPTAPPGSALEALLAGMKPISSTVEKTSVTKDNVSSQLTTDTNKPVFSHSVNTTIVRERDTSISSTSFSSTTSSYHQVSTQNAVQDTSLTRGNAYNVKSSTSSIPSSYTPSSSMNGSTSQSSSFSFQNAPKQTGMPAFVGTVCVTSKNEATESTTTSTSTTPHGKVSSPRIVQHSNLQPEHFGIRKTASFNDTFGQRRYTDRELCEFFDLFDTNDTGRIKRAQFYSLMQALGISVEEVHVGYFDYMDRETFLTTFQALNTVEDEARCAFQLFSQRKKAFTSDDLLKVVRSVYPTISKEEVLDVFHYCDSDRDGLISLRDWFTLLTGTAAKTL